MTAINPRFQDQTVVVTGAAGALGREVAAAFIDEGARLILVDLDGDALNAAFGELGEQHHRVAVYLCDPAASQAALGAAEDVDVICAIAGGFDMGAPVHDTAPATWKRMDDLNVQTLLNTVRALVPGMVDRGRGKIITVGANAARQGLPQMAAYCAAKSTVMRLTESMAGELRGHGINVNCVMPSILDTAANRAAMPDADPGDWVTPAQIAGTMTFLASDAAAAMHGALVPVTGLS